MPQGIALRRAVFSFTYPEMAIEVDDPHDTSTLFQHACPVVVRPGLCTRGFSILAPVNAVVV